MPRQIIDTESSRPRYVWRVAWTIATVFLVIAPLAIAFALHFPGK
jgi:type IV secretory pathway component VirB8